MRREGYSIEEIIEYSNMSEAFDTVLRGTDRKRSTQGRYLLAHREQVIAKLTEAIASGSFQLGGYHEREIGCFQWFKDTNLKANHNSLDISLHCLIVVSNGSKILI